MAADRIRDSSSSLRYDHLRADLDSPELTPSRGTRSNTQPNANALTTSQSQSNPLLDNGFETEAPRYARADNSGSFDAPNLATVPEPQQEVVQDPKAQLDALKKSMSLEEKKEFLQQFGVDPKHLKKSKPADVENAFNQIIDQLKAPGEAKLKFKIDGKKYEAKVRLDPNSGELDIQIKQKKGFFGKLWDGIKKVGKIALTVASFIPGPIGIVARVANAVISAVGAFKKGDILGGIAGIAGGIAGGVTGLAGKAISGVAKTVSTVASVVEKGALAAKGVADAVKNKNWGGLLTAVASGASGVVGALGNSAKGVVDTMNKVSTWATRGNTALQAAVAAKNGDIVGMLSQGSSLVSGIAPNSRAADTFQRIASGASTAQNVYTAAKNGDVLGALSAGADYASQQFKDGSKQRETLKDISSYATTASSVQKAVRSGDYLGAAEEIAGFAAKEVKDPEAKRKLEKASEIFGGANLVEDAIRSKDYLGAAAAATKMAGKLSGNEETQDAAKLLAAASEIRSAVKSKDPAAIIAALGNLKDTVKDVTQTTQQRAVPQPTPEVLPSTTNPVVAPLADPVSMDAPDEEELSVQPPASAFNAPTEPVLPEGVRLNGSGVPVNATGNPVAVAGHDYVVQHGDTLAKIAGRAYGDSSRWAEVYAFNSRTVGKDPNGVAAGARLQLPESEFRLSAKERAAIFETAAAAQKALGASRTPTNPSLTGTGTSGRSTTNTSNPGIRAPTNPANPSPTAGLTAETAKLLRNVGVEAPEKFLKFAEEALKLDSSAETKGLVEKLARPGAGLKTLEKLAQSYQEAKNGNPAGSLASVAEAAAESWGLLSDKQKTKVLEKVLEPLRGQYSDLADVLASTKSTDALKTVSGLLRGNMDDVVAGLGGVTKSVLTDSHLGKAKVVKLVEALVDLLPERTRDSTMKKILGRKVPVVGTLAVGLTDLYSIAKKPGDWTRWAGLGSTVAGAFPGIGTAASTAIDVGLLVNEIATNVSDIRRSLRVTLPKTG